MVYRTFPHLKFMIDISRPYYYIPNITIHTDELYCYGKREWVSEPNYHHKNSLYNLQNNTHHNKISDKAKRKIKRAVKYLLYTSHEKTAYNPKFKSTFKFKVNFITLTLSSTQVHTDQEIKSMILNQFFVEAKKKWGLSDYIWKAERQQNGNLHFHILTNVWIPWLELRNTWNRLQNKLGYIDRANYNSKSWSANSTDIHSLRKINNIPAYIIKYMIKKDKHASGRIKRVEIGLPKRVNNTYKGLSDNVKKFLGVQASVGKIWSCSYNLSNLKGGTSEIDDAIKLELELLKKKKGIRIIKKEHFEGIFFDNDIITQNSFPTLYMLLNMYIIQRFGEVQSKLILNPDE